MNSDKLNNAFNLALQVPPATREKTVDLNIGYIPSENAWEFVVRYNGDIDALAEELPIRVEKLLTNYAIITAEADTIDLLVQQPEIEYIEKPFALEFAVNEGRGASCVNQLQLGDNQLLGIGVVVGIIDSGIDYAHPDFRNVDGTTRIKYLWDQTIEGNPPEGYTKGTLYTSEEINAALQETNPQEQFTLLPSIDSNGHGTHVAGIACGNGRASNGLYRGMAPGSEMIIVKLGASITSALPNTLRLMEGIDFCIRTALRERYPIVVNLSYGSNYGSHDGRSLLEQYINSVSELGKSSIVVGTGNEGFGAKHNSGVVRTNETVTVELAVPSSEFSFSIQFWKNYVDTITIEIIAPSGRTSGAIRSVLGRQQFVLDNTQIYLYYAKPRPGNKAQEIYLEFIPVQNTVAIGLWGIRIHGIDIRDGRYNMWLPSGARLLSRTQFLDSTPDLSITVPSTAYNVISVGAYSTAVNRYAEFSGRGFVYENYLVKPDLVAPGVDIMSCAPGGGYTSRTGTSMATPFVSGAVALLMQWGIVNGNDQYLYGEKVKAYLHRGTRPLPGFTDYPNNQVGWGTLCVSASIPLD